MKHPVQLKNDKQMIIYVLHRQCEKVTYLTTKPFKKTIFDNSDFINEYPVDDTFLKYDIDNNDVWGQLSAHIRIMSNNNLNDIIGFGQYRRTFRSRHFIRRFLRLPLSKKEIICLLNEKDAIITKWYNYNDYSVIQNFERFRGGSEDIVDIINRMYPSLKEDIEIMRGKKGAFWNGPNIIAKANYIKDYYKQLIPFLFECYKYYKQSNIIKNKKRYLDYCGEFFFAVYHHHQKRLFNNLSEIEYIQYRNYLLLLKRKIKNLIKH